MSSEGRDARGRFAPGNSGRPKGTGKRARYLMLLELCADELIAAAINQARKGNSGLLRQFVGILLPASLPVELPAEGETVEAMASAVLKALAEGSITTDEAKRAAQAIDALGNTRDRAEMLAKLDEIRARLGDANS